MFANFLQRSIRAAFTSAALLYLCLALHGLAIPASAAEPRERIGESLGKPVYRDQIASGKNVSVRDELFRLFGNPAIDKYRQAHQTEITPTKEEIEFSTKYFDQEHRQRIKSDEAKLQEQLKTVKQELAREGLGQEQKQKLEIERAVLEAQLNPPGRAFAQFMLDQWKFQRHLYDQFGGGRILWQQAGVEAFDAMHKWLESLEARGDFKITDPKLRATFYEYWTTMKHGAFLTDDKQRIRTEFLEPAWGLKQPK